tara:strand:+ start:1649 stop:2020 length:372 start_codon:yes stop_codon:yes gene_type:complete
MKHIFSQWLLHTNLVFLAALSALLLFEKTGTEVAETLLAPWFVICRTLTPPSWQFQGNIPLGLMWLFSGVAVYSMLIGACLIVCGRFLPRRRLEQPAFSTREKKNENDLSRHSPGPPARLFRI